MNLKTGHLLKHGEYRVEKVLAQGGFGITYLCEQTGLLRKVAIKEFFMKELCKRESDTSHVSIPSIGSRDMVERFRQKFIKEARALAALNHKHIIRIIDVFEENNTAYYVMEYVGGGSLADKVKNGALPEAVALRYIRQVAGALDFVHGKRMMHLDVKPANILLNENDEAILIDFGLAKQYDSAGSQTSTTPVGISHGYAPLEQYKQGGVGTFSPATDIYSLGATLYKLLTGVTPPEAGDVNDEGLPALPQHISAPVRAAIEAAMQPRRKDRPKSISEFLSLLDGNVKAESGKVKTESNDDGETVIANSSTPGGEESRSDGEENVGKSKDERAKSKVESDGAMEILHSAQNDKKRPDGNTPKRPFNKRLFSIISVAAICIIAVIFGIKSCNDRKAAEAEAQRATAIAEQQRIDADRKAQERADSIAAEQQRIAKEEAERKRREEYERSNFNINNPPPAPTPKDIKERTILDLLYFPYGCLIEKVNSNESAAKALKENFGRSETVNVFYTGLHRNESYDYTYKGVPIGLCYVDYYDDRSWYIFYFETRSQAEMFESLLVEDIKNVGIPLKYDKIYGGMSNRGNSVSIFKWVYVASPVKITEPDRSNIHNSDVVGKYVVELGVYKTKSKSER